MLLAVDVGNSNVVFAALCDGEVVCRHRTETLRNGSREDYGAALQALLSTGKITAAELDGAILSSVVPEADEAIASAIMQQTGLSCLQVSPAMKTGMPLRIDAPDTLADDIICGCVGAVQLVKGPVAVVDMGTATTVVVVDRDGCYRGGAIMPGVKLSLRALTAGTSLLPEMTVTAPGKVIATETVESILSGSVYGTAAAIDGLVARMEEELGYGLQIVATGGLGSAVLPYCKRTVRYEADLLFRGMAALYEMNT